ncbi:MAG: hypothetical protein K8R21_08920, partial [Leptospira sp.]|nr:hypothetical protein [Leptospira sp.]
MNKSVSYSLLIAVVFTTVYCKRDSDILATFKGGTVLRSDLRTFYEVKEIQINKNSSSIQNQSAIIEDIALQKIAFTEYSNKYPVLPEEYNNLVSFIDGQLTAQLIKREFVENLKKSKEVEFAETQLVFIKKDKTGNPDRIRATRILSEINNLKSNKEIAEYVSKNTDEEARKSIGGLLEPHCMNCGNDPLKEILSNAGKEIQDKKFILKELDGNIYIIRVIETRKVSPSDIEKFVTRKFNEFHSMATAYKENAKSEQEKQSAAYYADDKLKEKAKMTAEHILKQFENNLWIDEYNKLKKNSQLTISGKATAKPTELKESDYLESTEILTKKDGTKFTFGDLEKEFKKINIFNRKAANPTRKDEIMERLNFFNQIYLPSYIFSQSP